MVILGGGYAWLMAALRLARPARRRRIRVTLVDAGDTFTERIRLHQVAAGQRPQIRARRARTRAVWPDGFAGPCEGGPPMAATQSRRPVTIWALRALTVSLTAVYVLSAILHRGVRVPLGPVVLAEPVITPAFIVEGSSALVLAIGAYGLFAERPWAWRVALAAHVFAVAGVLLGMWALATGRGPRTALNDFFHAVMLLGLLAGLSLLVASSRSVRGGDRAGSGWDRPTGPER